MTNQDIEYTEIVEIEFDRTQKWLNLHVQC